MKILTRLALPLAVFALAAPAAAQGGDTGTFRVYVDGREVGTEEFTITQLGSGTGQEISATGRVRVRSPEGTLELDTRLGSRGIGSDPVDYQVIVGGSSTSKIVGTVNGGRFSAKIVTPAGEQLREYLASSGAVVLDEGVAHHYHFLAQRTHNGRVPVIVPRENRQVMATVSSRGEESITVNGTSVTLFHLVVQPAGGAEHHVWVDALNRVLRVEVPSRSYRAERTAVPR
ncbi:hypothetical protein [Longimicrobium terrae]|uniref:DUF3108 domain-containing protein n=1 Tax=Longimicrobium terrae TaxID=1639882 RepID=A0A841GNK1_9BACT|nr:hypothetical protein [Longimicrobium terrae]MBB4635821.1 hypothetical protein [Longimicrobium terrae]MBB6070217.1 hypothetical protein [Longimicrobium terrae]NNC30723.1 hypothetical protein [Longimicrobium terrae]